MTRYRFGDCELDTATRTMQRAGAPVRVEPKVLDVVIYLIEHRARFLGHTELLDALWSDVVVAPAVLARAVKEARRAVGDDGQRQAVIATLHARGYRFVADVIELGSPASSAASPARALGDSIRPADGSTRPALPSELRGAGETSPAGIVWLHPRHLRAAPFPERGASTFGRGEGCEVTLSCKDASRLHAEVRADGPIHVLRDLGSINGTFVNGARVTQVPLREGDVVRMGDAVGLVTRCELDALDPQELMPGVIGSGALASALRGLRPAATSTVPVVMVGETGVGKTLAASALHALDARRGGLFVLGCAADPARIAAELFGRADQPGLLVQAAGGTLVLDHVEELTAELQARLLAALDDAQRGTQGASAPRVVSLAPSPLDPAVAAGRLRADLVARLSGISVHIPPLRTRVEDVPALFAHFLREASGGVAPAVSAGLIERLCGHDWPYNVRELQTLARRLLLMHAHEPPLRSAHLPEAMRAIEELEP